MIRTILIATAVAALSTAGHAQTLSADNDYGVTVQGRSPDAYIIRIDTTGKDEATIRSEISDAAYTACERAPLTGNALDTRVSAMESCVTQANTDAIAQMHDVLRARRQGEYYASAAF